MPAPAIDIVIPVFNEGRNITRTLGLFAESARDVAARFSISIVYDLDDDNTLPVVKGMIPAYPYPIRLIKNRLGGVCNALKAGVAASQSDFVLVTMADACDDYTSVAEMVRLATEGTDVVCGSRYMRGGRQIGGPWFKGFLSRMAGASLHVLRGVPTRDITNSFKIYSRQVLQALTVESTGGFEIGLELTAKAYLAGFSVAETPTIWRARTNGDSRFRMAKWLPLYMRWYLLLLFGRKRPWRPA